MQMNVEQTPQTFHFYNGNDAALAAMTAAAAPTTMMMIADHRR